MALPSDSVCIFLFDINSINSTSSRVVDCLHTSSNFKPSIISLNSYISSKETCGSYNSHSSRQTKAAWIKTYSTSPQQCNQTTYKICATTQKQSASGQPLCLKFVYFNSIYASHGIIWQWVAVSLPFSLFFLMRFCRLTFDFTAETYPRIRGWYSSKWWPFQDSWTVAMVYSRL